MSPTQIKQRTAGNILICDLLPVIINQWQYTCDTELAKQLA